MLCNQLFLERNFSENAIISVTMENANGINWKKKKATAHVQFGMLALHSLLGYRESGKSQAKIRAHFTSLTTSTICSSLCVPSQVWACCRVLACAWWQTSSTFVAISPTSAVCTEVPPSSRCEPLQCASCCRSPGAFSVLCTRQMANLVVWWIIWQLHVK